ncbi:MAG: DPP IV N-terminal domain-containing protein [Halanaerobium sp.]|nr:DPP IV N-terminal domain-containing protein [Halanaerobium sp.]
MKKTIRGFIGLVCMVLLLISFTGCDFLWEDDGEPEITISDKLYFSSNRDGDYEIYVLNGDGFLEQLTDNTNYSDWMSDYSAATGKIAFYSNRGGNNDIWVMDADGSNPTQLTSTLLIENYPSFSPDGSKIVYMRDHEIWVMGSDGSNQDELLFTTDDMSDPEWSPVGNRIAISRNEWDNNEIYAFDIAGDNSVSSIDNLTNSQGHESYPDWSPDGSKIAYSADSEIWVMDADGGNKVQLTDNSVYDHKPVWSPDGTKIFYVTQVNGKYEIFVMDLDGSNKTNVTNSPDTNETDPVVVENHELVG